MKIDDIKLGQMYFKIAADGCVHIRKITFIPPKGRRSGRRPLEYRFEYHAYNCRFTYEEPTYRHCKSATQEYMHKWLADALEFKNKEEVLKHAQRTMNLSIVTGKPVAELTLA